MFPAKVILHPTDFHESSSAAFSAAEQLAKIFGAKLIVLHVPQIPQMVYSEFGPPITENSEDYVEEAQQKLAAVQRSDGGELDRLVAMGDPETVIVKTADDRKCDLIVMGTAGRKGISRFILGSTAEHVSREAHCPVLLVKAAE